MPANSKRQKAEEDGSGEDDIAKEELKEETEDNGANKKFRLANIVRENTSGAILDVVGLRVRGGDEPNKWRDLFLTAQATQANVYEGKHLDLAAHFINAPNEHVTTVDEISCCCWAAVPKDENEALAILGSADGIIQVISVAECRVKSRLYTKDAKKRKVVDVCGSRKDLYTVASLIEDEDGRTLVEVWDLSKEAKKLDFLVAEKGEYRRVQFAPSRGDTIVVSTESEIVFFERGVKANVIELPTKCADVRFVNKTMLLLNQSNGECSLFDLESKAKRRVFPKDMIPTCVAVSACGKFIAAGDATGSVYMLEMDSSEQHILQSSKTKSFYVTSLSFGIDDPSNIVCASADGAVWRWCVRETNNQNVQ